MFTYKEVDIFYERSGTGDKPVLLLHGWGGNGKTMYNLYRHLVASGRKVILPDLMGFGNSKHPLSDMDVYDYAYSMIDLVAKEGHDKCDVVGHSFGGRIGLIMASMNVVEKLVLISSAGLKPRFSLSKKIQIARYKRAKRKGKDVSKFGSSDYRALDENMRKILVRVVNQHLDYLLPEIKCPTLIMWGDKDKQTPYYMAKKLLKKIKGSGVVRLSGGHFAYVEDSFKAQRALEAFLCS